MLSNIISIQGRIRKKENDVGILTTSIGLTLMAMLLQVMLDKLISINDRRLEIKTPNIPSD